MARQPYDAIKAYDADVIDNYIHRATGAYPDVDMGTLLSSWNKAKDKLFNGVFGKRLRMTTHVTADLKDDYEFLRKSVSNASLNLVPSVADYLYNLEYTGDIDNACVKNVLGLFKINEVLHDEMANDTDVTVNGKTTIVRGKRMRAIRKALELVKYPYMELFTQFRDRVSVIRTTQRIDTDVVLSIHPIDFLSMSDNKSGWTSCMSLVGKGSNRAGVTEYMNSPTAVVAYMESKMPYLPGVPNKSWRMMLFYDTDNNVALGSRQYPFFSKELAVGALSALTGCEKYSVYNYPYVSEDHMLLSEFENHDVKNLTDKYVAFEQGIASTYKGWGQHISPWSYGACNDFFMFHEDEQFFRVDNRSGARDNVRLQMSGKPTCLHCGKELEKNRWGTREVLCRACSEEVKEVNEPGNSV